MLLNAWWAGLIGSRLFVVWAERRYAAAEEVDEVLDAFGLVVAGDVLDVVAAVLAILFVQQADRDAGRTGGAAAAPVAPMPAGGADRLTSGGDIQTAGVTLFGHSALYAIRRRATSPCVRSGYGEADGRRR